jgi:hypothetical protein
MITVPETKSQAHLACDKEVIRVSHSVITRWDTVYVRDSVIAYRTKRDSIRICDSIPYPVEVIKEVPYVPKFYQYSTIACYALVAILLLVLSIRLAIGYFRLRP